MTAAPLSAFLLARYAEEEAAARAATGDVWEQTNGADDRSRDRVVAWGLTAVAATTASQDAAHIARHSPARVLADVEAKRRIVEDATNQHTSGPELDWVMQVLALPYADHPDYREEWKPADVVFP